MSIYFISADSHLNLHHMDGVPAPFDLLGSIPSLLDENNSSKAMIQVPEVHGGHPTLKVPTKSTDGSQVGNAHSLSKIPHQLCWYSQVSVLVKGIIGFDLKFPQAT